MKYSDYWPSIVDMYQDNHVLHKFLSCNLSFPSLSPVTSLIMPTNDGPVLMDFIFGRPEQFQNYAWHWCSKIITPMVNIIAYDSIQRCYSHRRLPECLSFNSLTLEPSCCRWWFSRQLTRKAWLACKWERNAASLNSVIYLRCFTSNGVSIISIHREALPQLPSAIASILNFKCGPHDLLYSNRFHKYSMAWYVL